VRCVLGGTHIRPSPIPNTLQRTMEQYVWPLLQEATTVSVTFDLWMSRAGFDTFTMVVNFIDKEWMPRHVTIGLFEAIATSGTALTAIVKPLLQKFKLENKVLAYVNVSIFTILCLNSTTTCLKPSFPTCN
jgi:hypothetical protein